MAERLKETKVIKEAIDLSDYRKIFNRTITPLLNQKGWSQSKLARLSSIHRGTMSRYMSGETFPAVETIARIADALGIPYKQIKSQIVMVTGKGHGTKLLVLGEEVKLKKTGFGGAIQSRYVSRKTKNTPTDQIDQAEWDDGGFSVVQRVDSRPSNISAEDWSYFKEISNRISSSERPALSVSRRKRDEMAKGILLRIAQWKSADGVYEVKELEPVPRVKANVFVFPPAVWQSVLVVEAKAA